MRSSDLISNTKYATEWDIIHSQKWYTMKTHLESLPNVVKYPSVSPASIDNDPLGMKPLAYNLCKIYHQLGSQRVTEMGPSLQKLCPLYVKRTEYSISHYWDTFTKYNHAFHTQHFHTPWSVSVWAIYASNSASKWLFVLDIYASSWLSNCSLVIDWPPRPRPPPRWNRPPRWNLPPRWKPRWPRPVPRLPRGDPNLKDTQTRSTEMNCLHNMPETSLLLYTVAMMYYDSMMTMIYKRIHWIIMYNFV